MKKQSSEIVNILLIILHFLNALFLHEIISTSYAAWYFKYFTMAYAIIGAFFILFTISKSESYSIEISKTALNKSDYFSNIEYIKKHTGDLEEEIVLKSVKHFCQQLELKIATNKSFKDFETLYQHFQNLDIDDKFELLYYLPNEYHTKFLKKLIKEEYKL